MRPLLLPSASGGDASPFVEAEDVVRHRICCFIIPSPQRRKPVLSATLSTTDVRTNPGSHAASLVL